jgi:hypothetical protein
MKFITNYCRMIYGSLGIQIQFNFFSEIFIIYPSPDFQWVDNFITYWQFVDLIEFLLSLYSLLPITRIKSLKLLFVYRDCNSAKLDAYDHRVFRTGNGSAVYIRHAQFCVVRTPGSCVRLPHEAWILSGILRFVYCPVQTETLQRSSLATRESYQMFKTLIFHLL